MTLPVREAVPNIHHLPPAACNRNFLIMQDL
jgi:hypothetical protein